MVAPAASHGATLPTGFEERTVASGLSGPTAIAWAPDGRMFIAEKARAREGPDDRGLGRADARHLESRLRLGDRGLLGIAVDSDFANNHYLYLLYVYKPSPAPAARRRAPRA